jgi:type I restriction enzyme S subunit
MRPYLRAANVGWSGLRLDDVNQMNFTDAELETYRLLPGDLLLSEASGSPGEVGKPALWSGEIDDCAFQNTLLRVRPREHEPEFLLHYFRYMALSGRFVPEARGVGINHLGRARLAGWMTPLPARDEQRRIVEILEEHLSHLDAAEAELARARSRSDALLLTALRAHVEELRSVGAPFARIGDVAESNLGKMLDAKKAHGEPTPYLANINVRWGRFDLENLKVVPLTTDERSRLTMQPGDVIVCEGGEPGRCAVWDLDNSGIAYQKALHRVRVHDTGQLEPKYLALMLRESIQSGRVDRLFTGTTIKHLPQEKLRLIEVPVPEHSVQEAALEELAAVVLAGERLAAALQIAKLRSDSLRRGVLTAAFEGKLTGRQTDTEVIEEMAAGHAKGT